MRVSLAAAALLFSWPSAVLSAPLRSVAASPRPFCRQAVLEGSVHRGEAFRGVFTPAWAFLLEPLPSGWVMRVVPASGARPPHDTAELATPPYRSVNPLLVSTDWAFRAQDAMGWNPRRFRYAANAEEMRQLETLYERMGHGDASAAGELAWLTVGQPEGSFEILDGALRPGSADQTQQAGAVASHFAEMPHRVDQAPATPLGAITELHFRVRLNLPHGQTVSPGVHTAVISCPIQPTRPKSGASQ